jgi:hypothetical protein
MNVLLALTAAGAALAAVPAVMTLLNLRTYRRPRPLSAERVAALPSVSVLIPARNEERSIGDAVETVLASQGFAGDRLEVVVLDDHSEDGTAEAVAAIARRDARVRLERGRPLPQGWCGKQHACRQLAWHARHDVLVFLDADVRLSPHGLAAAVGFLQDSGAELVSGIPRQVTGSLMEKLTIPLIHFVLLGYLPMAWMRRSKHPAYAAGCGQLFITRRQAYERVGGHEAVRASLHDGITLPRAYRRAGLGTDLFDATDVAACRMYHRAGDVWRGLAKNATEGMATPIGLPIWTLLLLGGHVLPMAMLATAWMIPCAQAGTLRPWAGAAVALSYLPRAVGCTLYRQSVLGALLHPVGVAVVEGPGVPRPWMIDY